MLKDKLSELSGVLAKHGIDTSLDSMNEPIDDMDLVPESVRLQTTSQEVAFDDDAQALQEDIPEPEEIRRRRPGKVTKRLCKWKYDD